MKKRTKKKPIEKPGVSEVRIPTGFWDDVCIACGVSTPEGYMLCPMCRREGPPTAKQGQSDKESDV